MAKEEKEHTKYYNNEGEQVPSVTTVMKILNKPELLGWANYLGWKRVKHTDVLVQSSEIGTFTHKLIEDFTMKRVAHFDILDKSVYLETPHVTMHCFKLFKHWLRDMKHDGKKVKFLFSEIQMSCDEFGGTADCICDIGGKRYLIDYKTSSSVYPSMFIQLSAYVHLLSLRGIDIDRVAILQLSKNKNSYQFVDMSVKKLAPYFEVFKGLLSVYRNWSSLLNGDWNKELIL